VNLRKLVKILQRYGKWKGAAAVKWTWPGRKKEAVRAGLVGIWETANGIPIAYAIALPEMKAFNRGVRLAVNCHKEVTARALFLLGSEITPLAIIMPSKISAAAAQKFTLIFSLPNSTPIKALKSGKI
jgi:hypothetical protein